MEPTSPPSASRRAVLGAGGALLAATPALAAAPPAAGAAAEAEAKRILERYQSFGDKASGGAGDTASGAWLEGELAALGFRLQRQTFDAPAYEGEANLSAGPATAALIPQATVVPTPPQGLTGPIYVAGPGRGGPGIALIVLPYARWSTAVGFVDKQVSAAFAAGASAAVIVTTGPTGEAVALNAPIDRALFDRPVAVLAPKDADPFLLAAAKGETATLRMAGRAFRRPAFNVTATLNRGAARSLVISTPRSGWFGCAGERGSGMAVFLMLVGWAARAKLPVDIALIATSGHEYENGGGEHFIQHLAPKPRPDGALGSSGGQRRRPRLARARRRTTRAAAQRRSPALPAGQLRPRDPCEDRLRRAAGPGAGLPRRPGQGGRRAGQHPEGRLRLGDRRLRQPPVPSRAIRRPALRLARAGSAGGGSLREGDLGDGGRGLTAPLTQDPEPA